MNLKILPFLILAFLISQCGKDNLPENENFKLLKDVNFEKELAEGIGGRYVPAKMNASEPLKILVIFAQFKDDNSAPQNKEWPVNQFPIWKNQFIAEKFSEIPQKEFSISHYFYEMSYGQNLIIGKIFPEYVIVDLPVNSSYAKANELILKEVDEKIDFREFDNWTIKTNANSFGEPDNIVDAVYIVYRSIPSVNWGGIAMLSTTYTTQDGPRITSRIPTIGMTLNFGKGGNFNFQNKLGILAHEYGHYLLGENHNFEPEFGSYGTQQRGIGLMPGNWETLAMNPQEKFLAGYINFIDIFEDQTGELPDFQTTGKAFRIPVPMFINGKPNTNPDEYFIVANHQKKSIYENIKGTGIYIYHVKTKRYGQNHIDIVCADGLWQWKIEKWVKRPEGIGGPINFYILNPKTIPLTENLPYLVHDKVDRIKGRDELELLLLAPYENEEDKKYWWDKWVDENGTPIDDAIGDKEDAFNIGYNEIFSPWSNPATIDKKGNAVNFSMQILENNNGNFKVKFAVGENSILNLPPSKPQNLKLNIESISKVRLNWEPNIEPDMQNGGYNIYRSDNSKENFRLIKKISGVNFSYEFLTYRDSETKRNTKYFYAISAVDESGKESIKSDVAEISVK